MTGSRTLPLMSAVTVAGRTYEALTIRAPLLPDVTWMRRQRGTDLERSSRLFARLCGVRLEVIEALDEADATRIDVAVEEMFRAAIAALRSLRGA